MHFLAKAFILLSLVLPVTVQASEFQLKTMVRTTYPQQVLSSSMDKLMQYILKGTHYRVYVGENAPQDAMNILSKKPGYQKPNRLMSRFDALLMAVGDGNSIIVDHDNKLISVTRDPLYDK